jgi:hypothetical protein
VVSVPDSSLPEQDARNAAELTTMSAARKREIFLFITSFLSKKVYCANLCVTDIIL